MVQINGSIKLNKNRWQDYIVPRGSVRGLVGASLDHICGVINFTFIVYKILF